MDETISLSIAGLVSSGTVTSRERKALATIGVEVERRLRTAEKVVEERAAWIAEQAVRIEDLRLPLHLALEGGQPVQQEIPQAPPRPARPRAWGELQGNNREV